MALNPGGFTPRRGDTRNFLARIVELLQDWWKNGIHLNPGSDTDVDIVTVDVTGSPTFRWDESEDRLETTHSLNVIGDVLDDGVALTNYTHPNHSGDVTSVGDGAQTIAADAVDNTKAANMAQNTIKGRITGSTGNPEDITAANVRTIINVEDGATADQTKADIDALAINADQVDGLEASQFVRSDADDAATGIITFGTGAGAEGGEIRLVKPATTSITNTVAIDLNGNNFRIFENGGSSRGIRVDLTACAGSAGSTFVRDDELDALILTGSGTPEGAVTAPVGVLFTRTDGGASTTLYVKESGTGNTGWVAK